MKIIIKGGRVIDPANRIDKKLDLIIEGDKISELKQPVSKIPSGYKVIDAKGKFVFPGLVDVHTHLREPGREDVETIATGTQAAARGGFTSICCMPNTSPVIDSVASVKFIYTTASVEGKVNVYPVGSITKGQRGEELAEIGKMHSAGIVAISDDGKPVMNAQIMRHALEYVKMYDIPVISHCEDLNLSHRGVMNEGVISTKLGLRGIPRQAEEVMVARDIALAELTGGRLHLAHLTTRGSIEMAREAKRRGIRVTCEVTPHHFTLTEEDVIPYNTNTKVNPPLRTKDDIKAIIKGLSDGAVDCIVSDHAPHLDVEKDREFDQAPFGIIGLETTLPLIVTQLIEQKALSISEAIAKVTVNPSKIVGIDKGTLSAGKDADVVVVDLEDERVIEDGFLSKSKNTPFIGRSLRGFATCTIVGGRIVYSSSTG